MDTATDNLIRNLPDLPELESVEVRDWGTLARVAAFLVVYVVLPLALFLWMYQGLQQFLPDGIIYALGLMAVLGAWLVWRIVSTDYYYRTDRAGMTQKGVFRRRFIDWSDVECVQVSEGISSQPSLRIRTRTTALVISSSCRGADTDVLFASVWQHLRRIGKDEGLQPTPRALSLWDCIPDGPSQDLTWGKAPHRVQWLIVLLLATLFSIVPILLWLTSEPTDRTAIILLAVVCLIGLAVTSVAWAKSTTGVVVSEEGIEAQRHTGTVSLRWEDVDSFRWTGLAMLIKSRRARKSLSVPFVAGNKDSERVILRVIRKLRHVSPEKPVLVPDSLRQLADVALREADAQAEVKMSRSDMAAIFVIVGLYALGLSYVAVAEWMWGGAAMAAAGIALLILLVRLVTGSYSMKADAQGITRSFLGKSKLIRWENIGSCVPSKYASERIRGRMTLCDNNEKRLLDIPPGVGSARDRSAFMALVQSRLSSSTPVDTFSKPWLARPFSRS